MEMIMTLYTPTPLFDTFEHLQASKYLQISQMKLNLPPNISENEVFSDYSQASQFLYAYRGSMETFKSYRREIEKLLQWAWFVTEKTLKDLRRNDLETFLEFCQAPPKEWIGTKHVPRFIDKDGLRLANSTWRPFIAAISKKA